MNKVAKKTSFDESLPSTEQGMALAETQGKPQPQKNAFTDPGLKNNRILNNIMINLNSIGETPQNDILNSGWRTAPCIRKEAFILKLNIKNKNNICSPDPGNKK